MITTNNAIST